MKPPNMIMNIRMGTSSVVYKEYYYSIKKNKIKSFAGKWIALENTVLNKINQT
jgi:hypothetical protein